MIRGCGQDRFMRGHYDRRGTAQSEKKNGGREGFPRLAAVCWAGGQLESARRAVLVGRHGFVYDGIISLRSPDGQGSGDFRGTNSRKPCAQSNERRSAIPLA